MSKLVTIFGGSGFVGRYIARRMAREGWRVRVAVRRPNEALFVKPYGAVGQVEPVACNIRDDASVRAALAGADAVVNCVGILNQVGRNKFRAVQGEGAARVARLAAEAGVSHLVHISAIGADTASDSDYARSKAVGEDAVRQAFPSAVILRPSVIFGPDHGVYGRFASLAGLGPIMLIAGGKTKMQPVYVEDVASAATKAVQGKAAPGTYELGGPEVLTLRQMVGQTLQKTQRRRLVINLPFWAAGVVGGVFDIASAVTGGLLTNRVLTRDQVRSLKADNVVADGAKGLGDLDIQPTASGAVIGEYLWRFRPGGQYADMTASAKNLRSH